MEQEYEFSCPHCWQPNTILLDLSVGGQSFIQDCEVCCNPLEITYAIDATGCVSGFDVCELGQ